jgi:hypothetical protein
LFRLFQRLGDQGRLGELQGDFMLHLARRFNCELVPILEMEPRTTVSGMVRRESEVLEN